MPNYEVDTIGEFTSACDSMISSKYILVDKRLGDVLKSIASTRQVFNLISECMVNFSFERELEIATNRMGRLTLPEEPHKAIAFIFCLLNLLDDKKINFNQFLNKYYSNDENGAGPYATFCNQVVLRFKNLIVSILIGAPEPKIVKVEETEKKENSNISQEVCDRLLFLAKDYKSYVHGVKKLKRSKCTRSELQDQVQAFIVAVENKHVEYMYALILGIKYSVGKEKELLRRLVEIEDIVLGILDQVKAQKI
ncbi:MAG: hypothetical protein IJS68_02985 [Clostridia bacterium]|nr:hypothetical protein [Clostridia bacterium]